MATQPPPLPGEILARVTRLATVEGYLLLFIAGGFALQAALARDVVGAVAATLAAGTGALEISGVHTLQRGDARGMAHLVRSQLLLLAVILAYCALRLMHPQVPDLAMMPDWYLTRFREKGLGDQEMKKLLLVSMQLSYVVFGVVSIAYQGGMALYYHRRREPVRVALEDGALRSNEG